MSEPRPVAPPRTVFVSIDVDGAAALWRSAPDAMAEGMRRFEAAWRGLAREHGGSVVRAQGDVVTLRFRTPAAALAFSVGLQRSLLALDWPPELLEIPAAAEERGPTGAVLYRGVRARIGIRAGPSPSAARADASPYLCATARLVGLAGGGSILVGDDGWVADALTADAVARDRLNTVIPGLFGVVDLVEVQPAELMGRLGRRPNPPPAETGLLGRDDDLAALGELFSMGVRAVSIVGPPGVGKSRLAREFLAGNHGFPSVSVDLAGATSAVDLDHGVATALGIPLHHGQGGREPVRQLGWALGARGRVLVYLDAVDGVAEAAGEALTAWLRTAPDVRFLMSARRRVGVDRELAYELSPLAVRDDAREGVASQLVIDRLRSLGSTRRWSAIERRELLVVCELLAGNPLLLELLAGQLATDPIARVHEALRQLVADPEHASVAERGAALLALVAGHLRPWERAALVRTAVFEGPLDAEAADAVFGLEQWAGAPQPIDVLERLVELGLMRDTRPPEFPGARMFTVPLFVREWVRRHASMAEREVAEARHAAWHVRWGEAWAAEIDGPVAGEVLTRLAASRRDLDAAVRNPIALRERTPARVNRALRLAHVADAGLAILGSGQLRVRLLDEVLAWSEEVEGVDPALVVRALRTRGEALAARGRWTDARADLHRAQRLASAVKDVEGEVASMVGLGHLLERSGDLAEALRVLEEARGRLEGVSERESARALGRIGVVHLLLGGLAQSEVLLVEAAELSRIAGDRRGEAIHVGNLGVLYRRKGDLDASRSCYANAIAVWRRVGDPVREAALLGNQALLDMHLGRTDAARREMGAALDVCRVGGDRLGEARLVTNLGLLEIDAGRHPEARALLHRAMAMNHDAGDPLGEGVDSGMLGMVAQLEGDHDTAVDLYARALELLDNLPERRLGAAFRAWWGAAEAARGNLEEAVEHFERARSVLAQSGDAALLALDDVLLGALDLYGPATASAEAAVRARVTRARGHAAQSVEVRLAMRWIEARSGAP